MGITPSFSPSASSENSANASLISASSCAEMSFSRASLDSLVLPGPEPDSAAAAAAAFRLGGCGHHMVRRKKTAFLTEPSRQGDQERFAQTYHFATCEQDASTRESSCRGVAKVMYDVRMPTVVEQLEVSQVPTLKLT